MTVLTNLVSIINQEHQLAYDAAFDALEHAILCGEALVRARENVPEGEWQRWIEENLEFSVAASRRYMRIATYRVYLMGTDDRPQSINAAMTYLRDIDAPALERGRNGRSPSFSVEEARRLRSLGMTFREIGTALGVSDVAVWRQLTPGATDRAIAISNRNRGRRRAEERQAAEREQHQEMADRGAVSDAYFLLLHVADTLERAITEADDGQHDLRKALTHVHRAELAVVRSVDLQPRRHHA